MYMDVHTSTAWYLSLPTVPLPTHPSSLSGWEMQSDHTNLRFSRNHHFSVNEKIPAPFGAGTLSLGFSEFQKA